MRIIERDVKGTKFAVWINKEEKNLLDNFEKIKKLYPNGKLVWEIIEEENDD